MKNNKLLKLTILSIIMLLPAAFVVAQTDSCFAKAPAEVAVDRPFQYTVTTNSQGEVVSSDFGKFEVVGGPSVGTSTSISMMNGEVDQKTTYTYNYSLVAHREGSFSIPGVTISVDGKLLKSNFVIVNVVKTPQTQPDRQNPQNWQNEWFNEWFDQMPDMPEMPDFSDWNPFAQRNPQESDKQDKKHRKNNEVKLHKNDVFVKATTSQLEAYQGEPVIVTHKLYLKSGLSVSRVQRADMQQTEDFWFDDLDLSYNSKRSTETIDGQEYSVITLRQTAVYPRTTGKLTIPALNLSLVIGIPTEVNDSFWGMFSARQKQEVNLESNDLPLKVRPLPGAHSNATTEVVGNFTMTSSLSRTDLHTNEPAILTITVSGTGNLHHVNAEDIGIEFPADWDVTRPRITDNISAKGDIVTGSRTFKYTLIPHSEGDYIIPAPTYTYYHFETGSYKTITALGYELTVTKGKAKQPTQEEEDKLPGNAKIYKVSNPIVIPSQSFETVKM